MATDFFVCVAKYIRSQLSRRSTKAVKDLAAGNVLEFLSVVVPECVDRCADCCVGEVGDAVDNVTSKVDWAV